MPYKHIRKEIKPGFTNYGPLNNSLTVRELFGILQNEIKKNPAILDKAVLVSDDEEGNCYHGCYYPPVTNPQVVKKTLESSNGGEVDDDVIENCIILG